MMSALRPSGQPIRATNPIHPSSTSLPTYYTSVRSFYEPITSQSKNSTNPFHPSQTPAVVLPEQLRTEEPILIPALFPLRPLLHHYP